MRREKPSEKTVCERLIGVTAFRGEPFKGAFLAKKSKKEGGKLESKLTAKGIQLLAGVISDECVEI